jgi:hypothetical protein
MKPAARPTPTTASPAPRMTQAPAPGTLASSITFFVSAAERTAILASLRAIHRDRAAALLIALKLDRTGDTP